MSNIMLLTVLNLAALMLLVAVFFMLRSRRNRQHAFHVRLITILTSAAGTHELFVRVSKEVMAMLGARHVSVFAYGSGDHYVSGGTDEALRLAKTDCHVLETYFVRTKKTWVNVATLDDDSETRRMLKSYSIAVAIPLIKGDEITGFMFLGEKLVGSYSNYDLRMVTDIRSELGIAVQNSVALQEVRNLNARLKQHAASNDKELVEAGEQLKVLDTAKEEFVSMASHQLRTPLTSVKGYISMVLEGDAGKITKAQRQLLTEAFSSSERMVHLIGDFLNVSRVQTGKFVIETKECDLVKLIKDEVDALKVVADSRELTLKTDLPKNPVVALIDEEKIRQVVMNFIDNAIFYSRPKGSITVSLKQFASDIKVEVTDTGIGVPTKQQARLFTKFFRADNARTQRPDGTGVGLYLAKMIINGHHGKLIFRSKENHGSTFGFSLPK